MTDARFPERWLNDRRVARLSDGAFRTFVTTLTWSVANRTDGVVELDDLDFIHGADRRHVQGLVSSGLWSRTAKDIFLITVFKETQTSRHEMEVLEHLRKREREKKARQRARGGSEDDVSPGTSRGRASPGTVARDGIGQEGQEGQAGQARRSRDLSGWIGDTEVVVTADPFDDWPKVTQPGTAHMSQGIDNVPPPWTPAAEPVGSCRVCGDPALTADENGEPCHPGCS